MRAFGLLLMMAAGAWAQAPVGASGQGGTEQVLVVAPAGMSSSRGISFEQMPMRPTSGNGAQVRDAIKGTLPTGEGLAVHESVVPAGAPASVPHVIEHAEVITIIEGTLEFYHDGRSELVPRGGVIYVAKGTKHATRNAGAGPARYVVVSVGGDAGQ